tara:strand:- start:272 stop:418 length:147 start_codon:yes stop_codon:yes gene_type:complete
VAQKLFRHIATTNFNLVFGGKSNLLPGAEQDTGNGFRQSPVEKLEMVE